MLRKILAGCCIFAIAVVIGHLPSYGAPWDLLHPNPDGSYTHTKNIKLQAAGTGVDYDQGVVKVHKNGNVTDVWVDQMSDAVGPAGGNSSGDWEFSHNTFPTDTDGDNSFAPFFDHDDDPATPLVWPPGQEGKVRFYKEVEAMRTLVETAVFTVSS